MDVVNEVLGDFDVTNNTVTQTIDSFMQAGYQFNFAHGAEVQDALSGLMIAVGVLLVLFGCRLFKATLFLITLIAVTGFVYFVGTSKGQDQRVMLGVGFALGIFCGLLAIQLWKVALFLVGALVGVVLFVVMKSVNPGLFVSPVAEYAALIVPSLILGIFSVCMERYWLLFATPILGAFLTMQGVDHFADLEINIFGTLSGRDTCVTNECYGLWGAVAGFALLGMLIQYQWTAGFDKTQVVHKKEKYVKQVDTV